LIFLWISSWKWSPSCLWN